MEAWNTIWLWWEFQSAMTSNTFNYTVLIDLEDISQWFSNQCNRLSGLLTSTWLSKRQILEQFQSDNWVCNRQVLWSGIPHDKLLWIENVAAPIGSLTATVLLAQSQGWESQSAFPSTTWTVSSIRSLELPSDRGAHNQKLTWAMHRSTDYNGQEVWIVWNFRREWRKIGHCEDKLH